MKAIGSNSAVVGCQLGILCTMAHSTKYLFSIQISHVAGQDWNNNVTCMTGSTQNVPRLPVASNIPLLPLIADCSMQKAYIDVIKNS